MADNRKSNNKNMMPKTPQKPNYQVLCVADSPEFDLKTPGRGQSHARALPAGWHICTRSRRFRPTRGLDSSGTPLGTVSEEKEGPGSSPVGQRAEQE